MGRERKGKATPPAPQNQKAPKVPGTIYNGFVGGLEVGVIEHPQLGRIHEPVFDVLGGICRLRWPLAMTPKVIEALQASYDEAIADGPPKELAVPDTKLWTPPT